MYDKSQENRQVWSILNSLPDQIWDQIKLSAYVISRGSLLRSKKPLWVMLHDVVAMTSDLYIGHCLDAGKRM